MRTAIRITQMDCPTEEALIRTKLGRMPEVRSLDFNLMQRVLTVVHAPDALAPILALAPGLDDGLFEHDGQLTKRDIRAVTLSALAPRQGELLWDVGLGAGSIAIEWLLRHPSLKAIGFEERTERAARAARSRESARVPLFPSFD